MIKNIPNIPNHNIIGFEEITPVDSKNPILYKPVYERVFALHGVFWDKSRSERIYLCNDTQGYTCEGELVDVNTANFELLNDIADIKMFWSLLSHNGYKIDNYGVLHQIKYWRPVYTIEEGFTPLSINADDDTFHIFEKWDEVFKTRVECVNWCNAINEFLHRNYPEVE